MLRRLLQRCAAEADFANRVGAVYQSGNYEMNTWIPCIWGFVCLLILLISSFTIQGAL